MPSHPPERGLKAGQEWDLEVLRVADRLGFSEAWIGKHFTDPQEPNPAPDLLIAQALMQTNRIKLALGAHLLPYHHPAELACRVAFMDHLAQGRYMFGVGASGTAASKAYLARISTVLPDIRERAAEVERLGRVSDDTIRALTDAGVFRAVQPRRWGLELDPASFFEGMVRIASACASTGWVASVVGVHAWHVSMFSEEAQREVW